MTRLTSMPQFTKWLLPVAVVSIAVILLSGCQTTQIALDYTPQKVAVPVIGADRVPVKISVTDARSVKSVGTADESNQYGPAIWQIYATNDVVALLKSSITDELRNRGFKLSDSGVSLLVGIRSIDGHSWGRGEWTLSVRVAQPDGTIRYSQLMTGKGRSNPLAHYDDGKIIKQALDKALQNCLGQLFADSSFVKALGAFPSKL